MGRVPWMSYFQPDAWCHQMMLKGQGYGQITAILAVNISAIKCCKVGLHEKQICHV